MRRHHYQLGPSTFRIEPNREGWSVWEEWCEIDRRGEKDHVAEPIEGPMTEAEARARAAQLQEMEHA